MARTFRRTRVRRVADAIVAWFARRGLGDRLAHVLTVPGRRTGTPHSTPVRLVELDGRRYLVGIYGPVGWVRNARAARAVTLERGGREERLRIEELRPERAVPVLRRYLEEVPFVRPYVGLKPDASDEALAAAAAERPVFLLRDR